MVKKAVDLIDTFDEQCFVNEKVKLREIGSLAKWQSLSVCDRVFQLLLILTNSGKANKQELKEQIQNEIEKKINELDSSSFINEVISVPLTDALNISNFFINSLTQQFENLYYEDYLKNEFKSDKLLTDTKKSKKKKKRKNRIKKNKKLFKSFTVEDNEDTVNEVNSEKPGIKLESDSDTTRKELSIQSHALDTDKLEPIPVNKQTRSVSDTVSKPDIRHDQIINLYSNKRQEIDGTDKLSDKTDTHLLCNPKKFKSHFIKKEHEIKENISVRDIKVINNNDKNLSVENYILIENSPFVRTDNKYTCKKNEPLPINHQNRLIEEKRLEEVFNTYGMEDNSQVISYFDNTPHSTFGKDKKPISCVDKGPLHVEMVKRTSSTDFNKKKIVNKSIYRLNEEINSTSINKTISTGADSRKFGQKKDKKKVKNLNIPFDLNEMNNNNSDHEQEGFPVTPVNLELKKDKKDEYPKNKSTEHKKHKYKGQKTQKGLAAFVGHEVKKKKKPKLKKLTKETKKTYKDQNKRVNQKKNKPAPVNPKKDSDSSNKKSKVLRKVSKVEVNSTIGSLNKWADEDSIPLIKMTNKPPVDPAPNNTIKVETKKHSLKARKLQNKQLTIKRFHSRSDRQSMFNDKKSSEEELPKKYSKKLLTHLFNSVMNKKLDEVVDGLIKAADEGDKGRQVIKDRINRIVTKTFNSPGIFVQEYGSVVTKLITPFSDMDLSIQGCYICDRDQAVKMLEILCNNLQLFPFVLKAKAIVTAAVPVIKLQADPSIAYENSTTTEESVIVEVDIIVDLPDGFNPINTALRTTDFILHCKKTYPSFFRNMLFLKFALGCNNLCNAYTGGLNAYGLNILYVAYLEEFDFKNSTDHFTTLSHFLKFLSLQFEAKRQKVCFGLGLR